VPIYHELKKILPPEMAIMKIFALFPHGMDAPAVVLYGRPPCGPHRGADIQQGGTRGGSP